MKFQLHFIMYFIVIQMIYFSNLLKVMLSFVLQCLWQMQKKGNNYNPLFYSFLRSLDDTQDGIKSKMNKLDTLVRVNDIELWNNLHKLGIHP